MSSKRKKPAPSPIPAPEKPQPKHPHVELLVIAIAFLVIGAGMAFAKRGELRPVPASQRGMTQEVAAMNAPEMRAYGWFGLLIGSGILGVYGWLRYKKVPVVDDAV